MRTAFAFMGMLLLALVILRADLQARQAPQFCEQAENTADVMACVKKRHDEAQKRLNTIFEQLLAGEQEATQEENGRADQLRESQKDWITYRDQECLWETTRVETESLKRIHELSCVTALTQQRADILALSLKEDQEDEGAARSYSATPRWMNALAADHPDVFWRYKDNIRADLDCDGEDEEIMPGLKTQVLDVRTEGTDKYLVKAVVAITENPATGRPRSTLFDFVVSPDRAAGQLCDSSMKLAVVSHKAAQVADQETQHCDVALQVNDRKCEPVVVFWDGERYETQPPLTD